MEFKIKQAEEIFEKTGILNSKILVEPNSSEREEMWNLTRYFLKKIYELDIVEKKSDKQIQLYNQLSHYCVVMLHWNDVYDPPHLISPAPQGRFRRDTIALALCIFTRISRDYKHYTKLKKGWINPHRIGSFLMWTTHNLKVCNTDNIFNFFNAERIQELTNNFFNDFNSFATAAHKGSVKAYQDSDWLNNVKNDDPTFLVFWKLTQKISRNNHIPYKFALNYIYMNEDMGGVNFLSEDRDKNIAFLQNKIDKESFPDYWDLGCDIVYLMNWLIWADNKEDEREEQKKIEILTEIFYQNNFTKKQNNPWDIVIKSRSILDDDSNKLNFYYISEIIQKDIDGESGTTPDERVNIVIDNVRANVIDYYNGNENKTTEYLSFILEQLQQIVISDNELDIKEYDFINKIQLTWGVNLKIWNEQTIKLLENSKKDNENINNKTFNIEDLNIKNKSNDSEFMKNYPGGFYCKNERWDYGNYAVEYPLKNTPFPNVFEDNENEFKDLFRRFNKEEVEAIVSKIKRKKTCITLPFVRKILAKKFDLRGLKDPFWFDPYIISGTDNAGILYFEQNGFMMNYIMKDQFGEETLPTQLNNIAHVDTIVDLDVKKGYNGYWEDYLSENADLDNVTSLKMNWYNPSSKNSGSSNLIQTHNEGYVSTLPIIEAIWKYGWKPIVAKSKGTSSFFLDGIGEWERFNSWDELIDWAFIDKNLNVNDSSNEESNFVNSFFEVFAEKVNLSFDTKITGSDIEKNINQQAERSKLVDALAKGNSDLASIKSIIEDSPDDVFSVDTVKETKGYTPLHYAVWDGLAEISKLLIDYNSNINAEAEDGRTPISLGSANGHYSCVELLIKNGANVNVFGNPEENPYHGKSGGTPLRDAVLNQYWKIVDLLIDSGADLEILKEPCLGDLTTKDFFENVKYFGETDLKDRHDIIRINELKFKVYQK